MALDLRQYYRSRERVCRHCGERFTSFCCGRCSDKGSMIDDECEDCHLEAAHGRIANQNIHICGSGRSFSGTPGSSDEEIYKGHRDS